VLLIIKQAKQCPLALNLAKISPNSFNCRANASKYRSKVQRYFEENKAQNSSKFALITFAQYCSIPEDTVQYVYTVDPRFNEPLYNEVLGIMNDIFQPSNSVMYGKEPRYNEPSI